MNFTDKRSEKILKNTNETIAKWADCNAADWVMDTLSDERIAMAWVMKNLVGWVVNEDLSPR